MLCRLALALLSLSLVSHSATASTNLTRPHSHHHAYMPHSSLSHHYPAPLTRFSFGSCNRQDRPQPLWQAMIDKRPQLFLFIGDTVYADRHAPGMQFIRWAAEPSAIAATFAQQKQRAEYGRLREEMGVIAVWDDHDYGENDGNINTPHKDATQQLFLDFLDELPTDVRRTRRGLYTSYTFGPRGQRVRLILLDVRYWQSVKEDDLLGAEQWAWLAEELDYSYAASPAHSEKEGTMEWDEDGKRIRPDLLIIASSIQFAAQNRRLGEAWRNFPRSRYRVLSLLAESGLQVPTLFLSGDVHYGEYFRTDICVNTSASITVLPVVDVTSSGLTHSTGANLPLPFAITHPVMRWLFNKPNDRSRHTAASQGEDVLCTNLNYGLVNIDWQQQLLTIEILGQANTRCMLVTHTFDSLRPHTYGAAEVPSPAWPARASPHPLSTSSGELAAAIERCKYELVESGQTRVHVSGLPGLASVAGGVILLLVTVAYAIMRLALGLILWLVGTLRRQLRIASSGGKKTQ